MAMKTKIGSGNKSALEGAIQAGTIDSGDIVFLKDTEEAAFIKSDNKPMYVKSRTQEPIKVNGVTGLGIGNGQTIPAGKSLDEIVKMLVQKAVPATYTKPSASLTNNGGQAAGAVEAGTSITPKLRATFNKNDAGNLTKLEVLKGGESVGNGTSSPYDYTSEPIVVGDETISFTAKATYEEGAIKNDNLGQQSPNGHILAGSVTSSAYSITGQRYSFWGSGVGEFTDANSDKIRALTNKRLNLTAGTKISLKVETGQQYIIFALPEARKLTQVIYDDLGDKGMLASFNKSTVKVADARGGENGAINYNCYVYPMKTPCKAPMNFTFVVG